MSGFVNDVPSTCAMPFSWRSPLSNDTPVTWFVRNATPGAHALDPVAVVREARPWVRSVSATTTGPPLESTVVSSAPTPSTESNAAGYVSRGRPGYPAEATMNNPSGWIGSIRSRHLDHSLETDRLELHTGRGGVEVAGHGAERVDDHRRPVLPRHVAQRLGHPARRRHVGDETSPVRHACASCTIAPGDDRRDPAADRQAVAPGRGVGDEVAVRCRSARCRWMRVWTRWAARRAHVVRGQCRTP